MLLWLTPDGKKHKEARVDFGSQFQGTQSILAGKAWLQEWEVSGYTVSAVREQRER